MIVESLSFLRELFVSFLFTNVWGQHFFFILLFKPIVYESVGLNSSNRKADFVLAIKNGSTIEQRLIYESCYVCIKRIFLNSMCATQLVITESDRNLLLENDFHWDC